MSLIRLAWASVSIAFALLFAAVLGVSLGLVRQHLEGELQHAAALAAQRLAAAPSLDAAVQRAAAEPAGWQRLQVADAAGRVRWQRGDAAGAAGPLAGWLPVRVAPAVAPIGTPAAPVGTVEVLASGAAAERLLATLAGGLALGFAVVALVLGLGLAALQRRARRPLDGFNEQIKALGERRFVSVEQPTVTEWVELSKALNVMVARVRLMLDEKDNRLEGMRDELNHDALTGVASRSLFIERLKAELQVDTDAPAADAGAVVILRVNDLVGMNQRVGRGRTDDFLRAVATAMRMRLYGFESQGAVLARLNGADFGVLLPGVVDEALTQWLHGMVGAMQGLHDDQIAESPDVAWLGVSSYRRKEAFSDVLSRTDAMVTAAETRRLPFAITSPAQPLHLIAVAQWRVIIETALDTGRVQLAFYPVKGEGRQLLHEEAMLRLRGPDGALIAAADFIPPAVRTGRVMDLDLRAIELSLKALGARDGHVAVNVSPHSIRRPSFLTRLQQLLAQAPQQAARLWIEVDETGLGDAPDVLLRLTETTRPFGCRVGIEHFGQHFSALPRLRTLRIDYLKLDAAFCAGAHRVAGQQHYVELVVRLASAAGIAVIAEGVSDADDLACLERLGISGATGPLVSRLLETVPA